MLRPKPNPGLQPAVCGLSPQLATVATNPDGNVRAVRTRVVVSGIGCVSAFGTSADAFRARLLAGESGIAPITAFATDACRSHLAASIRDFDAAQFVSPLKLRRVDAVGKVALGATRLALADAGLLPAPDPSTIGIVLGTATAGVEATGEYLESLMRGGPTGAPALIFASTVGNAAASLCALEFGLRGPNTTVTHKEASALSALACAIDLIRHGKAQVVLSGGADDIYGRYFLVHDWLGVLSPRGGGPEGSRPFDATRNGFVMGEGGFVLALEEAAACEARGGCPYGELLGWGATSSPEPINHWPSSPRALSAAMRLALDDAGVAPADVGAVFAAANGTCELDGAEAAAIADVFGAHQVPVVSIKGAIGECGASGAAALAAALVCGRHGLVPPTAGCSCPDPACEVAVSPRARPLERPVVLVNSFASGGTNYSVVACVAV
jgi:3-oxoacyl-[acyl-carrier-protein] synthase II